MSSMPFTSRRRPSRWLRLALAVLALVASHVSIARAALGATCARTGAASVTGLATAVPAATGHGTTALGGDVEVPHDVPVPPALAPQCAPSAATLPPRIDVPAALIAWDVSPPPAGPEARPVSHAPPLPFHPPRVI